MDEDGDVGGGGEGEADTWRWMCSPEEASKPDAHDSCGLFVQADRAFLGTDTPIISSAAAFQVTCAGGKGGDLKVLDGGGGKFFLW